MNILVDENIPKRTVVTLRSAEHVVIDLRESDHKGASDDFVWTTALENRALVITTDKGFVRRGSDRHHGILVVRLRQPNRDRIHDSIVRTLGEFDEQSWPGQTVVVRDQSRSVRRSGTPPSE